MFDRPNISVYLDGVLVRQQAWDHRIDPGGPLGLGAKSGRHNLFQGAIDRVHIYASARAPMPDDHTRYAKAGDRKVKPQLTANETDGSWRVATGALDVVIDSGTGAIRSAQVDGKALVSGNAAPPLAAEVMTSATYNGTRDASPEGLTTAQWQLGGLRGHRAGDTFVLDVTGRLDFGAGDAIDVALAYRFAAGERRIALDVGVTPVGAFTNRFVRSLSVDLPLKLDRRKRVVSAGDQGVREDVRHLYDFHTHVKFLEHPDHNCWRHFYVDQESANSYVIWRSEDTDTAPITGLRGRRAPGWMGAYDQTGGVLVGYAEMAARAPKCLYVNATAGGSTHAYLWPPTQRAIHPSARQAATGLFAKTHRIQWVFFEGEMALEQPERELTALTPDRPDPEVGRTADDVKLFRDAAPAPGPLSPMVEGGVPIPRGRLTDPRHIRLFVGGRESVVEGRPLAFWPDRSIKWLLLIFSLEGGTAEGSGTAAEIAFRVTRRRGPDVPCRLLAGPDVRNGAEPTAVAVAERADGTIALNTGALLLEVGPGQRWMRRLQVGGQDILATAATPQSFVDFLRPGPDGYRSGTSHPAGTPDPGPVEITDLRVEKRGMKTVVRLEGMAQSSEPSRVIIRLETWAGRPFVRLFHSVEFLHEDPRRALVRRMGLQFALADGASGGQVVAGGQRGPITLSGKTAAGLSQVSHLSYRAWQLDAGKRWPETVEAETRSRGWFGVSGAAAGLSVIQRDMWQEFPKELRYDHDVRTLTVGHWPDSAPLMDCRRYSNYPHQAQGESVRANQRWVLDTYYPNDPFKGVSKTHETILFAHPPSTPLASLDAVAADFQSRPLVVADWDHYAATGVTMPLAAAADTPFNANMLRVADWWLYHQRAWGWYGMWDYGDVGHRFRAGYGRVFPPDVLERILALPPDEQKQVKPGGDFPAYQDYFTQNDWAYDNGRWGWSNTEGLINHFMSLMYLRTGRRDLFFFVEANARHVRDVDARHAGKWFGRGTRHGVQHWSDGNHEERQTTFTEQRFHYLLTGEHRTREWNRQLTENWYLKDICRIHAAHSGRTYGLLTHWEMTGDPRIGETLRNYMHALATPAGVAISTAVAFPEGRRQGEPVEVNGESMFFHAFGGMHAMLEYAHLTGDPVVRDAIIATADHALRGGPRRVGGMLRKVVAYAAREAPDPEPYRKALRQWCTAGGVPYVYRQVAANPDHWSGGTGFLAGNVSGGLFWASDALYVLGALDGEPELPPERQADIQRSEERPPLKPTGLPKGSWQSEYDRPEFEMYLRDRLH
ncbi:MAG: hypothetical protein HN904_29955 [Victivallales bacterium]|nr:hypothetical protein [Victivallales bacterium]